MREIHFFDLIIDYYIKFKENFNLLHNNTMKTISNTARASVLIVIVYHLKS